MDVSQIGAQAQSLGNPGGSSKTSNLGQEEFLKLLVAQMQNQDPINPMDSKQFASQLAQFNSVEQLIGVNDGLSKLQGTQDMMRMEMTNSMAASLTGKEVRALSDGIMLEDGTADINYKLKAPAEEVQISIKDASGNVVRTETINGAPQGNNDWTWDGTSNDGVPMQDGEYSVEFSATSGEENVKVNLFAEGTAEQVRFTGNGVMVSVGGVEVPIGNIETVGIAEATSK